ncbi:flippase [Butyrivibrio fibrisolvens]|uniref:flippase n=1 Tax=Pseudobutyrivibrio ruminis TaxID=46206 RepID=UPI000418CA8C|nr:flippase [Pseudobutyrivibrio ruminis]MDC7280516.1 flippase [Butyrivibrio fibrisolvens]
MKTSLKKNFILQVLYQILIIITPLFTAPYISRVLGPENVGINSYSYAVTSYFAIVAALGIENYGSRLIAKTKDNREELNKQFSQLFTIHFLFAAIVYIIFLLYCVFVVKENKLVFFIQSFVVLGVVFDINWLYFGLEEFKKVITKNSILKLLNVALVFLLVRDKADLPIYVGIIAIGIFVNYAILWVGTQKYVKLQRVNIKDCLVHIKPLFVLFLPAIAVMLYKYMDKIMLMNLKDSSSVGFYDSGEKIIVLCLGLINALGVVMLPRVSNLKAQGDEESINRYFDKSLFVIGFISIGCACGAFGVASDFVPLFFGKGYDPSITVMKGLAITLPFSAYANVAKTQYVLPNGKDTFFARTLIGGALINFVINFLLIPKCGVLGATIGTICTEVFVCVVQLVAANKDMHTFKKLVKVSGFLGIGIIMILTLSLLDGISSDFLRIVVKVFSGGLTYLILSVLYCWFVNKQILVEISGTLMKKLRK